MKISGPTLSLASSIVLVFPLFSQQVTSVFPLGGQQGSSFQAEVRGQGLEGAYAVWFDCDALKADLRKIEEIELEPNKPEAGKKESPRRGHIVSVDMKVDRSALAGVHTLRLVTPKGISGPLAFWIHSDSAITEIETPHGAVAQTQPVGFSTVISGTLSKKGEVDFYAFDVPKGRELRFEVLSGSGFFPGAPGTFREPELVLYAPTGSWFNPQRGTRLQVHDESIVYHFPRNSYTSHYLPRLAYRFDEDGRYVAAVGTTEGFGGPDFSYQLRITAAGQWTPHAMAHPSASAWEERDFSRHIEPERLSRLWSRTVQPAKKDESSVLASIPENERPGMTGQAVDIRPPGIIEGTIERPADVDEFTFKVQAGDKVAFEIETPRLAPPYFAPRLAVLDGSGHEVVNNIYRKISGDGDDWAKSIEPKTIYTFEQGGEYHLRIRDLTSQNGNSDFRYRILVRPQIPHIGEVAAKTFGNIGTETEEDRINLAAGSSRKLMVLTSREEGFDGEVAISFENLPPGVQAFPATGAQPTIGSQSGQVYEERGAIHIERYRPRRLVTTVVLVASADAPVTEMPRIARLVATPIVQGRPGLATVAQELPVMVIKPPKPAADEAPKATGR